jgi:hypothetical protein
MDFEIFIATNQILLNIKYFPSTKILFFEKKISNISDTNISSVKDANPQIAMVIDNLCWM